MAKRLAAILCTVAMLLGCIASMACAYADGEQTSAPDAAPTSQESPAADGTVPEATTDAALQSGGEDTTPPSGEKTEETTEPKRLLDHDGIDVDEEVMEKRIVFLVYRPRADEVARERKAHHVAHFAGYHV